MDTELMKKKVAMHRVVCENLTAIYENKNFDYGDAFASELKKFGDIVALIRIHEKYSRLESIFNNGQRVSDETSDDTLLDMANYCLITYIEHKLKRNE